MGWLHGPPLDDLIERLRSDLLLDDVPAVQRAWLVEGLVELDAPNAIQAIELALGDEDDEVREAAEVAFEIMGAGRSKPSGS